MIAANEAIEKKVTTTADRRSSAWARSELCRSIFLAIFQCDGALRHMRVLYAKDRRCLREKERKKKRKRRQKKRMLAIEIGRKTFALLPTPANNTCRLSDQRRRRDSGRGGRPRPRILEEARRVGPEPVHGRALRLVSGEEEADDRGQEGDDDRRPARVLNRPPRNAAQAAESALSRLGGDRDSSGGHF